MHRLLCSFFLFALLAVAGSNPSSTGLAKHGLTSHIAIRVKSHRDLYQRLTTSCQVDSAGHPHDPDVLAAEPAIKGDPTATPTKKPPSNHLRGATFSARVGDPTTLPHDDPAYVPPLCNDRNYVCYYLQAGITQDGGPPPQQNYSRKDNTTVLVYRYWQGSVHFHGSKGSALVYAAHGCILLCAHQGMAARTLITQQKAVGHPGDNQLYCAVDRVLYDDVVIYNQ